MAKKSQEETMDLDIGHFVSSYDSLREQLDKLNALLRATDGLRRWEVPSLTLLCCIFVITLCITLPEFLLAFCLSPIPLILLATGIKNFGQTKQKPVKHIVVTAVENEEEKLKKTKERREKTTKNLRKFIKIICELQHLMMGINKKLVFVQSLFSWKDPHLTLWFMGCVLALMLLFILIPVYLIMLTAFLVVFLKNEDFTKVLLDYLSIFGIKPSKWKTSLHDQKECYNVKWRDASCGPEETDSSSCYEDDSNQSDDESIEETFDTNVFFRANDNNLLIGTSYINKTTVNIRREPTIVITCSEEGLSSQVYSLSAEKRSRSFVSHFSEYRKRRQEFKRGNCAACEVAFSSLLTRRRYCRRCGDKFCSKCCKNYVTKAALGATAPGSRDERVLVCNDCYKKLRGNKAPD